MKFKFIASSLFLLISYFVIAPVQADETEQFILGEHYIEIEGTQTSTPQVTEFFSFYCPHCYKAESFMGNVKKLLEQPSQFVKTHVDGMPGKSIEVEHLLTKALVTARLLNIEDKMVAVIFSYIHKGKADFSTAKEVKNLFLLNGVDSVEFDKTFGSFKVNMAANTMRVKTSALRKQGIGSVPTLIINGKFKPNHQALKTQKEYLELISFLLTKTA
jgi:thiol:disulfide interchange protein DsbA